MILAFWRKTPDRWFIPGRYCHVSILDHLNDTWVETNIDHQEFTIEPFYTTGEEGRGFSDILDKCTLVQWERRPTGSGYFWPMTCVSLARQYSGVPSRALFPDGLLRDVIRHGGSILNETEIADNRPGSTGTTA